MVTRQCSVTLHSQFADAPSRVQLHSASATLAIPEDPTIKGIFADTGDWMKISASANKSDTDIFIIEIPKSQVVMLDK